MIALNIIESDDNLSIVYHTEESNYWKSAIELGIKIAFEKLSIKKSTSNCSVHITEFGYMDVDTNLITVRYTAIRAVYNAFNLEGEFEFPKINSNGKFVFE